MLGIEDYGSDVESSDETSLKTTDVSTTHIQTTSSLPPTSKSPLALPPPKTSLSLPPPLASTSTTTANASSVSSKPKRTKKITINLPSLPSENDEDDSPPAKKARVTPSTGAGKSSLLSMLPAPKQPVPVIEKKVEERVLGGGSGPGLVFRAAKVDTETDPSTSFFPLSLQKRRANVSVESDNVNGTAPSVDFFSLGSHTPARSTPTPSISTSVPITREPSSTSAPSFSLSSAPTISTFRPPSPTLDDPYPGYYQLPSGAYAPYDAEYYASYARKWKADYDKQIRALEKAQYEPETDGAQDVDMAAEMNKARREVKEREDKKALTTGKVGLDENGEPVMPRMNVKGAKLGAVARSRHQLTTLLTEAYLNRDALEEKIAQGRRNRKEAGNKYGF